MKELKITVITPTYNRAHTLPRAFEALKKQTFQDFKWIIMDDGSTDDTAELIENFKKECPFEIDYFHHSNRHKFHTVIDGIEKVKTPYFTILDSDDWNPPDALLTLLNEVEKIENPDEFIGVMGLSADENGKVVGDKYPMEFDGSIFDMRYKLKVKGDKNGMFITKTYQRILEEFDYSKIPERVNAPHRVIFNYYDAKGIKTRFINKIVRIYFQDQDDKDSLSHLRDKGKNLIGLKLAHRSFLNDYGKKLYSHPKILLRNLIGYEVYSLASGNSFREINEGLDSFKSLATICYPAALIYYKLKFR